MRLVYIFNFEYHKLVYWGIFVIFSKPKVFKWTTLKKLCVGVVERDHKHKRGVVFIFNEDKENSKVIDIVTRQDNFLIHKQIEIKNGLLFMRLKRRLLNPVHA